MNYAALALMTLSFAAGQGPTGYQALKSRSLKLDLDVDPKQQAKVSHVELFVSRDRGGVWEPVAQAKPDQKFIPFNAKEDGLYWLSMVVVFKDGTQDPANVAAAPPAQKLLIDATAPVLKVRDARRDGEQITVEWSVDDAFPSDERTKVEFRLAGGSELSWKSVPVTAADRRGTRFNPNGPGGVQVRVTVEDQAGNAATQTIDVGSGGPAPAATNENTTMKPTTAPPLVVPQQLPSMPPLEPGATTSAPTAAPSVVDLSGRPPLATGSGVIPPAAAAQPLAAMPAPSDAPPAVAINFLKFDLPYQLEAGPSGISRIDLYVTRDEGQTWAKWSEHDGRESPLKVSLDRKYNPQSEGTYGFRIIPISGAGLSDGPPGKGTTPEFRVQVDLTPPIIKIFQPEADANQREILTLKWEVTDRNLGKEPIALEWSEGPNGPWKPIIGGDAVVPVAAGNGGTGPTRIANTGSYGWKLPTSLPSHKLYIKVTAWDLAGNKSEVATPAPILVDLVKPRAKIQGLIPTSKP